jgi:hypothetical protein
MSTPIDLRAEYGHRWKIGLDAAAGGRWSDPWNFMILCRNGEICPWGDGLLAASTHRAGAVANRLLALEGVDVIHDGDDGASIAFPISKLKEVTKVMKPRTARRANPAQLAALERGRLQRVPAAEASPSLSVSSNSQGASHG